MKGLIMETCSLCGKLKKRGKVKYVNFTFTFVSDDDTIKSNGYLCKKCIKKIRQPLSLTQSTKSV